MPPPRERDTEVVLTCLLSGLLLLAVAVWLVAAVVYVAVRTCGVLARC
jgi:hypothetical protein